MTSTLAFIQADFSSTLFPLKTNRILAEVHGKEISDYIYQRVLSSDHEGDSFLSQHRVHSTKPRGHLRRTAKLDPVAEYFIYDLCYRNRSIFRPQVSDSRLSFGYRFANGTQIPVHTAFNEYKQSLKDCAKGFKHNIQFDIASYFNSIYHHDICHWFASKGGVSDIDGEAIGQFFREINSGRSIDFLPHGIYPSKMLGNEFLKFLDLSGMLKAAKIVRFMDDVTLFDDDPNVLKQDFIRIQQLLGQFALNINPSKTYYDNKVGDVQEKLTDIRQSLTEIVTDYEEVATASGVELVETEVEIENSLNQGQVDALMELLRSEALEESDADLILGFLRTHSDSLLELLPTLLERFPNLIKHIYSVCAEVHDKEALANIILEYLSTESNFLEYQLFWLAVLIEDHLLGIGCYGDVLVKLYELTADMKIARAKVLEIPEQGFGFKELRDEFLKTGQSDWLSWSSAIGSQSLKAAERNYALDYFSKSSQMNYLVASGVKKL
ncbi:MAG: RNA-directed DNA polymerase [Candidatus Thiodiazotropha sp. (ex Lucinoma borealis)]|nr:RNA-directed DNA polymerase [Candidatus Thiodiazotropha sp. (ex Lucinoma borealis)]